MPAPCAQRLLLEGGARNRSGLGVQGWKQKVGQRLQGELTCLGEREDFSYGHTLLH